MHEIIYASRTPEPMRPDALTDLLEVSRRHNAAASVTGMLLYSDQSFLQLLEGDELAVEEVYGRISRDPRHVDLRILQSGPRTARRFDGWAMGFAAPDADGLARDVPGFLPATRFPLVDAAQVPNAAVAETVLKMYARNALTRRR